MLLHQHMAGKTLIDKKTKGLYRLMVEQVRKYDHAETLTVKEFDALAKHHASQKPNW
jgi:hypothetical protein